MSERNQTIKIDNTLIKDKLIRKIRTFFEQQEEGYYKPKRVSNF